MRVVSITEARAMLADIVNQAQKEPVVLRRQKKDVAVVISPEEYEKLRKIRLKELDDICVRASEYARAQGLTEEKLTELLSDER